MPRLGHRVNELHKRAEGAAQRCAHEQRRRENTARRARAERGRRRDQLRREQQCEDAKRVHAVQQHRLNGGVTDALDEIVAVEAEQRVDQHADAEHADDVTQIGIGDFLEQILGEMQAADEASRGETAQRRPESRKAKG